MVKKYSNRRVKDPTLEQIEERAAVVRSTWDKENSMGIELRKSRGGSAVPWSLPVYSKKDLEELGLFRQEKDWDIMD